MSGGNLPQFIELEDLMIETKPSDNKPISFSDEQSDEQNESTEPLKSRDEWEEQAHTD